jgi:hypothetical protein
VEILEVVKVNAVHDALDEILRHMHAIIATVPAVSMERNAYSGERLLGLLKYFDV